MLTPGYKITIRPLTTTTYYCSKDRDTKLLNPLLNRDLGWQQQLLSPICINMSRSLNGKTSRDFAIKMDQSVLDVTCVVVPYFFRGYSWLLEIPDRSDPYLL